MRRVKVKFAEKNQFGVLDHDVTLPSRINVYNPMRVFPNNDGSELVFTLYRRPDVSDQEFAEDAKSVERLSAVKDFTWKNKFPSTRNDIFTKTADELRNQKVPGNLTLIH